MANSIWRLFLRPPYRNIFLSIILSLIMGVEGCIWGLHSHLAYGGVMGAYWLWSYVWGLKLLYHSYMRRVKSERFLLFRLSGYFYWGAFYICWSMLYGFFGGGIYKFIIDIKKVKSLKSTELMVASQNGDVEVVKMLLNKGADVNSKTSDGITALIWATLNGHIEVVKMLIDKGANVNANEGNGMTALIYASDKGYLDVVQSLLYKGADVNAKLSDGNTALIYAADKGYLDVVQALLNKGADVNAKASDGMTALDAAKEGGHVDVQTILEKAKRQQ